MAFIFELMSFCQNIVGGPSSNLLINCHGNQNIITPGQDRRAQRHALVQLFQSSLKRHLVWSTVYVLLGTGLTGSVRRVVWPRSYSLHINRKDNLLE